MTLGEFVERCGRPRFIIENRNRPAQKGRPDVQVKFGSSQFLIVNRRVMSPLEELPALLRRLTSQGISAVEIRGQYRTERASVVTTLDVEPLSREGLREFVRERRVVSVGSYFVMGDEYDVSMHVATSGGCDCFLFESPATFEMPDVSHDTALGVTNDLLEYLES